MQSLRDAELEQPVFAQRGIVVVDEAVFAIVLRGRGGELRAELRGQFLPGFFVFNVQFYCSIHITLQVGESVFTL
jgi:hypothetical protein